jgi:hypothetical protein
LEVFCLQHQHQVPYIFPGGPPLTFSALSYTGV